MNNQRFEQIQQKLFQEGVFVISNDAYAGLAHYILAIVEYSNMNPKKEITLYLSAQHNIYYYSMMLYDMIKAIPNPVSCVVMGEVSGYTTLIAAACEKGKRYALKHCILKMEQPTGGLDAGTNVQTDVTIEAKNTLEEREEYERLLVLETGLPADQIHQLVEEEREFKADEAVKFGIIDKVI